MMHTDTSRSGDLVERLAAEADNFKVAREVDMRAMLYRAADRIEQLEREKAVVSDLWSQQTLLALDYLADCNKAADRIEALEAEVEGLREALEEFVASTGVSDDPDILLVEASVYEHATRILGERR